MTWFKVDDQAPQHPKMRAAGVEGRALWAAAGPMCASRNTDGVVEALVIKDACYLAEVDQAAAVAALVASGLWHDAKTIRRCDRCKQACGGKLAADAYYFHDWLEYQLTKDVAKLPQERIRDRRRKALYRDRQLCEQVLERDGTICRYCNVRVDFKDRRTPAGGTFDHVDPDGPNTVDNVVVACRRCNGIKKDRTPAEAGMTLLPAPARSLALVQPGSDPDLAGNRTGLDPDLAGPETDLTGDKSEPGSRASHARDRNRPGRARSGTDPDLIPARSGPDAGAGLGPGQATITTNQETP